MISFRLSDMLTRIAVILSVTVYLSALLNNFQIVSICFALSIACVIFSYILKVIKKKSIKFIDILMFGTITLSIIFSGLPLNFDYYKPAIIVICTIVCIDLCPNNQADAKTLRLAQNLLIIAAIATNLLFYFGGLRYHYYKSTNAIHLNFSNPNETGMWLAFLIILLIQSCHFNERRGLRLLSFISALSLFPILYQTQARSCLIAVVFFLLLSLFCKLLHITRLPNWFCLLVTLSPALVYLLYMYVFIPHYDFFYDYFSFLVGPGKSLRSRYGIWAIVQADAKECLLLGKYSTYYTEQLHNSLATLLVRFGVGFVILVCHKTQKVLSNLAHISSQLALCSVWIIGCFETAIFVGMGGLYLLTLLIPIFVPQCTVCPDSPVQSSKYHRYKS